MKRQSRLVVGQRLGWWALVAAGTGVAHVLGRGDLAAPPWNHPTRLASWWQRVGTPEATFTLLRVGAVVTGLYLLSLGTLCVAWRLTRRPSVLRLLGWVTAPSLRAALLAAVGISGISLSTLAPTGVADAATLPDGLPILSAPPGQPLGPAPVLHLLAPIGPTAAPPATRPNRATDGPPVLHHLDQPSPAVPPTVTTSPATTSPATTNSATINDPPPAAASTTDPPTSVPTTTAPGPTTASGPTTTPTASAAPTPSARRRRPTTKPGTPPPSNTPPTVVTPSPYATAPPPGAAAVGTVPETHVTVAGDSLWSIADATLTGALGHPPAPAALAQYWWQVVQANRAHLPDPGDPDLIFPGNLISLPAVPPPVAVPSD